MNKIKLFGCCLLVASAQIVAADAAKPVAPAKPVTSARTVAANKTSPGAKAPLTEAEKEARRAEFYRKTGGLISQPGSNSGKIVFINAQERYPDAALKVAVDRLAASYKMDMVISHAPSMEAKDAAAAIKKMGGASGVAVLSLDPALPALMVFPDERCSVVNVAAIPADADPSVLRKQLLRGFAAASGALYSQVPITIMSSFDNMKKLAAVPSEEIPADVGLRVRNALRENGVKPYRITTYKHACREGWAPQPKDEAQKAVWDSFHTLPTEGIKIKYDPKKGE